jgi:indolepyruvate ferredoxin oxidoreductase beta subunit
MKKSIKKESKPKIKAKKQESKKNFNIVIVGTGGQGLITLLEILANAARIQGYDAKTSELHGLSQRGGSVEVHVKFGDKVFSPLVEKAKADLILGLEMQECLKAAYFASPQTSYLISKNITPIPERNSLAAEEIIKNLQKYTKKIEVINANEICQKELGTPVVSGIFLLSLAVFKGIVPIKPENFLEGIKQSVAPKHLELNEKTFKLAETYAKQA